MYVRRTAVAAARDTEGHDVVDGEGEHYKESAEEGKVEAEENAWT
jgi:hypothetical protein